MPVRRPALRPFGPRTRRSRSALEVIPGVGESIARDLEGIGITRVVQLRGADPDELYMRACDAAGVRQDRCLLYVFRCAVYFASTDVRDPEKLKWWNWKDAAVARTAAPPARQRAAMQAAARSESRVRAHGRSRPR